MYAYPLEELAWAIAREREEEARHIRPHTEERPRPLEPLRSWLSRWLIGAGPQRARPGSGSTLRTAGNGCC